MGGNYDRLGRTIDAPSLWESSTIQLDAEQMKMRNMTYNFSHTHYRANVLRKSWCSSKDTARDLEVECRDTSPAQRHMPCGGKNRGVVHQVYHEVSGFPGPHFWGTCPGGIGLRALMSCPWLPFLGVCQGTKE